MKEKFLLTRKIADAMIEKEASKQASKQASIK